MLLKLISQLEKVSCPEEEIMISRIKSILLNKKKEKEAKVRKLKLQNCLLENFDSVIFYNSNDYYEGYTFKEMEDMVDKEDEILKMTYNQLLEIKDLKNTTIKICKS